MRIVLLLAICCIAFSAKAQDNIVSGSVKDTLGKKFLQHAVVTLINKKDSQLVRFTRTDENGQFKLNNIGHGAYILMATYPKFADFSEEIEIKSEQTDMGVIALTLRSKLMETVVVRSAGAIRIKGDTTEFVADSFAVKEGATVEELLRKFPGFQVNSKGEITAQGRRVEKVLVDGEEFFGDDPTVATQNLSAKAVDKVQVYDNKSEQQNLTGVSTGNEGKTINIKLKEDAKRGTFGKVNAGTDFDDFVEARVMFNRFRNKKKMSVYGTRSTVNTGSLSWDDQRSLGIEDDWEYDEVNNYYTSFSENDGFNDWSLRGLPNSYTGGALFIDKWNEEKQSVNSNYRFNRLGVTNNRSSLQQNITGKGTSFRNQKGFDRNLNQQHNFSLKYEWKPDSLTSFKLTTNGSHRTTDALNTNTSEFIGIDGRLANTSNQTRTQAAERVKVDNVLTWKQLFNKKNRQLITTFRFGIINDDQDGLNVTQLRFYDSTSSFRDSLVDQQRIFDGNSKTYGGKATFIEPLTNKLNLILDYSINKNDAYSYRNTFNKTPDGKYGRRDSLFSNNFDMDVTLQSASSILRYMGQKWKFTLGAGVSATALNLQNKDSMKTSKYRFLNLIPQAQVSYVIKPQENISLSYRGTTIQPSINQLQPIRDNNDPLNVFIGNPNLEVGFNHNFYLNYNQNKVLKQRYFMVALNATIIKNAITFNNSLDDQTGKQTYMPVNIDGNYRWSVWSNLHKGFANKWYLFTRLNANGSRNFNFINGLQNRNQNATVELTPGIGIDKEEKYSLTLRPKIGHSWVNATVRKIRNSFWIYGGSMEGMVMLPGKLRLETDLNYDVQGVIQAFGTRLSVVRWNATLSKSFFKKNNARVMLVANDLLNQNIGFNRNLNSAFISEDRFDRIAQYFLLKFEWSFTKMPGNK